MVNDNLISFELSWGLFIMLWTNLFVQGSRSMTVAVKREFRPSSNLQLKWSRLPQLKYWQKLTKILKTPLLIQTEIYLMKSKIRLTALVASENDSNIAATKNVLFIFGAACKLNCKDQGQEFGKFVISTNFIDYFQNLLKNNFKKLFDEKLDNFNLRWFNVKTVLSTFWVVSEKSAELNEGAFKSELHWDLLKYLKSKHLYSNFVLKSKHAYIARAFLCILYNIVRSVPEAKLTFRKCKAVKVLKLYYRKSEDVSIFFVSRKIKFEIIEETYEPKASDSLEEIFREIETRLVEVSELKRFHKRSVTKHIIYISYVVDKFKDRPELGTFLARASFLEFFQNVLRIHFRKLFDKKWIKNQTLWFNIRDLVRTVWNISSKSVEISEKIVKVGLHVDILEHLRAAYLDPCNLNKEIESFLTRAFISVLHNVASDVPGGGSTFRECGAVDDLERFSRCDNEKISQLSSKTQMKIAKVKYNLSGKSVEDIGRDWSWEWVSWIEYLLSRVQ